MNIRQPHRRYRNAHARRVRVFSEVNQNVRPDQIARIIAAAGLEQARLEVAAKAEHQEADNVAAPETGGNDA